MLFKRLLNIFRTKPHSQKKGEITCTECGHTYDNKIEECLQCWYLKIVEDEASDKKSDNLRVIKNYTLNLKCITSPSLTLYSFPSIFILPASFTLFSEPYF